MAVLVLVAQVAAAAPRPTGGIGIQALMNPDGSGRLLASNGSAPWIWETCSPDLRRCEPFGRGRQVETRGAPPGTVFRVVSEGAVGISPRWRGQLRQVRPPSVAGELRANAFVSPISGRWSGGWEAEFAQVQLSACARPAAGGKSCTPLTNLHFVSGCDGSASPPLGERSAGAYLRVAERRVGPGPPPETAYGVTSPTVGDVWGRSPSTAVAVVGQIAPAVGPGSEECGPAAEPASAYISRTGTGYVDCPAGCDAELVAAGSGTSRRRASSHSALLIPPPVALRVSPRFTNPGNVRLILRIDGGLVARRTVRF